MVSCMWNCNRSLLVLFWLMRSISLTVSMEQEINYPSIEWLLNKSLITSRGTSDQSLDPCQDSIPSSYSWSWSLFICSSHRKNYLTDYHQIFAKRITSSFSFVVSTFCECALPGLVAMALGSVFGQLFWRALSQTQLEIWRYKNFLSFEIDWPIYDLNLRTIGLIV